MQILHSIRREQRKIKDQLVKLERQLNALGAAAEALGSSTVKNIKRKLRTRRKLSAAGRLAISRAAKARWARVRSAKKPSR